MKRSYFALPALVLGLILPISAGVHAARAATPTISGFTPGSGPVGTPVYVTGANFAGTATVVKFNGILATTTAVNANNTTLATSVPVGATTGTISVKTAGGSATSSASFLVTANNAPTITSFTPTSGGAGTSVVIHGTNLSAVTSVNFNGSPATTVTLSPSGLELTAMVPEEATTGPIDVTNASGTATSSSSFERLYLPFILGFSRDSGPVGCTVFIEGFDLFEGTVFKFNGVTAQTQSFSLYGEGCYVTVPVGATSGFVTATNGGGTTESFTPFTVTPAPTITGFSPHSGPIGTALTITGTNFVSGATVNMRGNTGATTVNSAGTQIMANVPGASTSGPLVVNVNGANLTTTNSFIITSAAGPTLAGFVPTTGTAGTTVEISGIGLTGASAVSFGGVAATSFSVNLDGTRITAVAPTGGISDHLSVTFPVGVLETGGYFLYPPQFNGFSPQSGPAGTVVTLNVLNMSNPTRLTLNGQAVPFTVKAPNVLTFVVPANGTTGKIGVTTSTGSATTFYTFTKTP